MYARIRILSWTLALVLAVAPMASAGPVDDQYALAAGHYAEQRYEAAVREFRALIGEHPDHLMTASARFFLGESLLQLGKYRDAAAAYQQFVDAHPQHRFSVQASFRIGESHYLAGDYAAAEPKLQAFAATHPNHPLCEYALPYLAEAQLEQGRPKDAQAAYQRSLQQSPGGALASDCRLGLARAAEELGDLGEAERFYRFLAERADEPLALEARLRWGRLLYRQQKYAEAAEQLRPLVSGSDRQRPAACYWLGHALAAQKKNDEARDLWAQAIEAHQEHELAPAMALSLGELAEQEADLTTAARWYDRAARDWPRSAWRDDALARRVEVALASGQHDDVERLAARFDADYPDSPLRSSVADTRGRSQLARGKFAEAAKTFETLAREPSADRTRHQYALVLAHLGAKAWDQALLAIGKIERKSASDEIQGGLLVAEGSALVALGRAQEAIAPLERYLHEHAGGADEAKCLAQLCAARAQTKDFDAARKAWQQLADKHAGHAGLLPATLYLAEAAAEAGEYAQSRQWFEYLTNYEQGEAYRQRALAGLAWLDQASGRPAEANARLDKLLATQSDDDQAAAIALRKAQNYEKLRDEDNALAAYLQLIEKHPQAPQVPDALLAAARLHDGREQDREALALLERLVAEHEAYRHLDAALYQMAWVLVDLDRPEEAAQKFLRLHEAFPQSTFWADATYRLAEYQVKSKRFDDSSRLLAALVAANPSLELLCHALFLQGQSAAMQGKWDDVAAPLERLVTEHPKHELALLAQYWLAEAEYRTGKLEAAGIRLADLSTRLEGRTDEWLPMVPLRQAQVLAHEKRWDEAFELASTIADKYPDFRQQYEVDYLLGRCLAAQAKFDAARAAYQRVIRSAVGGRSETAAMAQWMIGETYFQQERYDEAVEAYHRVERLYGYPRWQAAALLQAGKCHETQGKWREAIQLYAQVLKQYSQTHFRDEASQRLRVAEQRAATLRNRHE